MNKTSSKIKISSDTISFYRQVFSSILTHSLGLLIAFIGSILLTRSLGVEGRGILSWIMSFHAMGIILVQLGIGFVGRKFTAKNPGLTSDIFLISILICIIGSVIILPILGLIGFQNSIGYNNKLALLIGLAASLVGGIAASWGEILVGLKNNKGYNTIIFVQKFTTTALYFVIILLAIANPLTAIIAITVALILKSLTALYFLRGYIKFKLQKPKVILSSISVFMFSNYAASVALYVSRIIIPILLGILASAKEVGLYAAPLIIVEAMIMVPQMIGMYLVPKLVCIKEPCKYNFFTSYTLLFTTILMSLAAAFFYLIAEWFIPFVYGKNFAQASEIFKILLIGMVFFSLANIFQSIITAKDQGYKVAIGPLSAFATSIIFCNILIPFFGAKGAASTWTLSSIMSMAVAGTVVIYNHLNSRINNKKIKKELL